MALIFYIYEIFFKIDQLTNLLLYDCDSRHPIRAINYPSLQQKNFFMRLYATFGDIKFFTTSLMSELGIFAIQKFLFSAFLPDFT